MRYRTTFLTQNPYGPMSWVAIAVMDFGRAYPFFSQCLLGPRTFVLARKACCSKASTEEGRKMIPNKQGGALLKAPSITDEDVIKANQIEARESLSMELEQASRVAKVLSARGSYVINM